MTAPDDRVWLTHPEHGGYFHCPAEAVEIWTATDMGWVVADEPPEEPNPVIAEALAFRAEQARLAEAEQAAAKPARKKAAHADTDTTEGN